MDGTITMCDRDSWFSSHEGVQSLRLKIDRMCHNLEAPPPEKDNRHQHILRPQGPAIYDNVEDSGNTDILVRYPTSATMRARNSLGRERGTRAHTALSSAHMRGGLIQGKVPLKI